jgi:DNA-binding GntR family transcriptional regulator
MSVFVSSQLPTRPILGAAPARLVGGAHLTLDSGLESGTLSGITVGRENLSQRAYLRIRSSLIHSELRPGQRLVLRPLAAELQLSPTPVREALLRLVSEQALTLDERGSAIVPVIGLDEFREIVDIRCDLEGRAAARAAIHAGPSDIEQIAALARGYEAAAVAKERAAMLGRNAELHRMVCRAGRAPLILRILEGIWMRIGPVYALSQQEPATAEGAGELHPHDRLVTALRNRDGEAARAAVVADVRRSSDWLEHSLIAAGEQIA